MATDKKSFLLYTDLIKTVEKLPVEKQAALFMHILQYVNDQDPQTDDLLVEIAFEPIKQQLKRDLVKYEGVREKRSAAGRASADKRQQNQHLSASVYTNQQAATNSTVNDTVNVNGNVTVNDTVKRHESVLGPSAEKIHTPTPSVSSNKVVWNDLPTAADVPDIPPDIITAAIRNVELMKRVKITEQQALDYWETWKVQYLHGQKYYKSPHEVYSHYLNCIKNQPFNVKNFTNEQQQKELSPAAQRIAERNKQQGIATATGSWFRRGCVGGVNARKR